MLSLAGPHVNDKPNLEFFDERQLESLRVFHEVASALTANLDLDSLLRSIMRQMEDFFGPEQWSLWLVEEDSGDLVYTLAAGDLPLPERPRVRSGEGMIGGVAKTGEMLRVDDVATHPEWSAYSAAHPEVHLQSFACHPIVYGGRTLGVLWLNNSKLDRLPNQSLSFLRVLCDYAAIALHNAAQVKLIHDLSITDDCTGLFNARYLYTTIEERIAASQHANTGRVVSIQQAQRTPFSLLFLDLDHFKSVNDTHGHQAGTRLLAEIGSVIKRTLGPDHTGFRYGGDEFVVLLNGLGKPAATAMANRLRDDLNSTRFLTGNGLSLCMTASFGLATYPEDGDTVEKIIRSADSMMYIAKHEGRNRIAIADATHPVAMPVPKISRHND